MASSEGPQLRAFGLCGVDDGTDPDLLAVIASAYPEAEFGVLFRSDKEGTPRYATMAYVRRLAAVTVPGTGGRRLRLAGHLCGNRVLQVLSGDASFVEELAKLGFRRVQVNATAINGVDTSRLADCVDNFRKCINAVPGVEWIVQRNAETKPLWESLLSSGAPANMSMLYDASCGTGKSILDDVDGSKAAVDPPHESVSCGYAGGIGPENVVQMLHAVAAGVPRGTSTWIDMESSLRSELDGRDVFSVDKAFACLKSSQGHYTLVDGARKFPSISAAESSRGSGVGVLVLAASAAAVAGAVLGYLAARR